VVRYTIIVLLCICQCAAQELTSLGNYAGLATLRNNPSQGVLSRLQYDVQLFSANVQAFNSAISVDAISRKYAYHNDSKTTLFAHADVAGPGVMFINSKRALAFTMALRTAACTNGISRETSLMGYRALMNESTNGVSLGIMNGKQANAICYGEVAMNYSRILRDNSHRTMSIGITGKLLLGYAVAALSARQGSRFTDSLSGTVIEVPDIIYAYAAPDPERGDPIAQIRGKGFGTDIGFTYLKKQFYKPRHHGCPSVIRRLTKPNDYLWRLSVSLLDIGGIRFDEQSRLVNLSAVHTKLDTVALKELRNNYKFDSLLRQNAQGASVKQSFSAGMPTSLVIQYDRSISRQFFIQYYVLQRVIAGDGIQVLRPNQMSICPRFESMDWDLGVKLGIMEYKFPAIGAAIRYKSFRIGGDYTTDPSLRAVYGLQLYMSLGIHKIRGRSMPTMRF
jgi:hypothetical protein